MHRPNTVALTQPQKYLIFTVIVVIAFLALNWCKIPSYLVPFLKWRVAGENLGFIRPADCLVNVGCFWSDSYSLNTSFFSISGLSV